MYPGSPIHQYDKLDYSSENEEAVVDNESTETGEALWPSWDLIECQNLQEGGI